MENIRTKKRGAAAIFALCPGRHCLLLISSALVLLHICLRSNYALMAGFSDGAIARVRRFLAELTAAVPFSVAELLICAAIAGALTYIIFSIVKLISGKEKLKQVYITIITLAAGVVTVYAAFCLLWGGIFYGDDFVSKSGMKNDKISARQLETVTEYFAELANEYAPLVPRDENGVCASDRAAILERSDQVLKSTQERLPCLMGAEVRAKGIFFSRGLS